MSLKSNNTDGEWVIGGDFNAVKNIGEKVGRSCYGNNTEWNEFSSFIKDIGLVDIPCKGRKFSWHSGDGKSKSRIDCFPVSDIVVDRWGVVGQFIGQSEISYHCPVWLVVGKEDWGLKPFKLKNECVKR